MGRDTDTDEQTRHARNSPLDSGVGVLCLAAFPMILLLFQGSATTAFVALIQIGLFLLGARLIHRGQEVQRAYEAGALAQAPHIPRKMIGCIVIGAVVMVMAGRHFVSLHIPLGFGALATWLGIVAFGMDPLRERGDAARAARIRKEDATGFAEAETALIAAADEIASLGDAELERQVAAIKRGILALVRALCDDSDERRRLRKPVMRLAELLERENAQLQAAWPTENRAAARKRYLTRVQALAEAFEERARRKSTRGARDSMEIEADLLWHRMRQDRAA
ncbi:hypothetical protein [Salipiger mucosus]|uniref:Uncharacterized protein n=1 Tax=Salipiger mucosus DSM 16094 TaxID=1123237 RepID=S9Q351_9RHOB|nr:hypothetical protein [Salipiger mucosus]EPX75756.1 hypothetical protein Salmuc_05394 [Salipiger mucosus DSM 16094]